MKALPKPHYFVAVATAAAVVMATATFAVTPADAVVYCEWPSQAWELELAKVAIDGESQEELEEYDWLEFQLKEIGTDRNLVELELIVENLRRPQGMVRTETLFLTSSELPEELRQSVDNDFDGSGDGS